MYRMTHQDTSPIIANLKRKGYRASKTRHAIIEILVGSHGPFSVQDIQRLLGGRHISTHITTIYRELELLIRENVAKGLQFGENKKLYELASQAHHHHLICVSCTHVQDVTLEKDLDVQEQTIARTHKFKVLNHSLEFFGLCKSCST
jgi:Fe2+ or Zn2+ uptake regulation protein